MAFIRMRLEPLLEFELVFAADLPRAARVTRAPLAVRNRLALRAVKRVIASVILVQAQDEPVWMRVEPSLVLDLRTLRTTKEKLTHSTSGQ
jgi:hypothetical protein